MMSQWRRKRDHGVWHFPARKSHANRKSKNLLRHSPGGGGVGRRELGADAGERVGSGGNGGITCLRSIFFTEQEKDNVQRRAAEVQSRGLRGDRLETGPLWDETLSGYMCTIARLYQDRRGAVGDQGLGPRMFSGTEGESRGAERRVC